MIGTRLLLLVWTIFTICESAYVDKIDKCGVTDKECIRKIFRGLLDAVIADGIPEMDIPSIEPYVIKNLDMQLFGLLKFTIVEGTVKGFKNCEVNNFMVDIASHRIAIELECENFDLQGKYKLRKTSTLNALIGNIDIHGDGKSRLTIDKLKMNIDLACNIEKLDDNELHFEINSDDTTYNYEILDKMTLSGEGIFIGKQDITAVVVNVFNENWEVLAKSFGKTVIDEGLNAFNKELGKFFKTVPINKMIDADLSAYVS